MVVAPIAPVAGQAAASHLSAGQTAPGQDMQAFRSYLKWSKTLPIWLRLAFSVVLVMGAALLRWALDPWLVGYPYTAFFAAVVLSSLLFDRASGFLATLLSGLVGVYLFVPPRNSLSLADGRDVVGLFVFLGVCFVIVMVSEAMRSLADALEEEKAARDALFRQMIHRTRNNLQIISSTLAIQAAKAARPEVRRCLNEVAERIGNIGRVHQRLYPPGVPEWIGAPDLVEGTCADLTLALAGRRPVVIRHQAQSFTVNRELAASLAIMMGELVDNAVRHAFPDDQPGVVTVRMDRANNHVMVTVSDNGIGCGDLGHGDMGATAAPGAGIGQTLVSALARQLNGTALWEDQGPGCRVTVRVPLHQPASG